MVEANGRGLTDLNRDLQEVRRSLLLRVGKGSFLVAVNTVLLLV